MSQDALNLKEQFFDRWAPNYDFLFPSVLYQAVHKRLLEYVTLPDRPSILDLGCGTGRLLNRLAAQRSNLRGIGLDFSAEMLRQARRHSHHRDRLIYLQGNAAALPFSNGQFDAVFSTLSFLHYPEPKQVFSEVGRVLHSKGCFHLVDPISWMGARRRAGSPRGIRFYSPETREQLGMQVGLNCLGHYHLLGPVLLTIFTKSADIEGSQ